MRTLNLGILAHVDAGKTSLTERLLYAAGAIDAVGRVDHGTTQTDTLALEHERGITIKTAVASLLIGDVAVNLIDTPGHPDFIAEVDRSLGLLDGAVLVISAVEGVQAQTRILMRALQRRRVPTLIFVNKIDRMGADSDRVCAVITATLSPSTIALQPRRPHRDPPRHRRVTPDGGRRRVVDHARRARRRPARPLCRRRSGIAWGAAQTTSRSDATGSGASRVPRFGDDRLRNRRTDAGAHHVSPDGRADVGRLAVGSGVQDWPGIDR